MNEQTPGAAPGGTALAAFSDALADAVAQAGRSIVRVDGRHRQAASGIVWTADGLIVTADHVVERDDDLHVGLPDGRIGPCPAGRPRPQQRPRLAEGRGRRADAARPRRDGAGRRPGADRRTARPRPDGEPRHGQRRQRPDPHPARRSAGRPDRHRRHLLPRLLRRAAHRGQRRGGSGWRPLGSEAVAAAASSSRWPPSSGPWRR